MSKETLVVSYINGDAYVPQDLWALVRRYRFCQKTVDTAGGYYARSVDEEMNACFDAMMVLVEVER